MTNPTRPILVCRAWARGKDRRCAPKRLGIVDILRTIEDALGDGPWKPKPTQGHVADLPGLLGQEVILVHVVAQLLRVEIPGDLRASDNAAPSKEAALR